MSGKALPKGRPVKGEPNKSNVGWFAEIKAKSVHHNNL